MVAKSGRGHMAATKKAAEKTKVISSETTDGRAKLALMPGVNSAIVINAFCKTLGAQSVQDLMQPLQENIKAIEGGDLASADAMLISQANALQTIFTELSRRAAANMGEYMGAMETYLRLALKAQAQCTRTLEVLAAIKNPPVVFAKQANIAHGHQQINNASACVKNIKSANQTILTGESDATLDAGGTPTAIELNQALETMGTINRP